MGYFLGKHLMGIDLMKGYTRILCKAGTIKIYELPSFPTLLCSPSWDIGSSINSNKRQSVRKGKTEGEAGVGGVCLKKIRVCPEETGLEPGFRG